MATEQRAAVVVSLNGLNYATWKVQCQMALIRDGLWGIVNETEQAPEPDAPADRHVKFASRRNRALATIVLAVEPSLLYLLGDPEDPIVVWKKLRDQFQKKTWVNRLALRRKLHTLQLKDGESVQDHIKAMTELFNELTAVGDVISEEDRVVYLLASLPDTFGALVTALEANEEVPRMEIVTERLLHTERKQKEKINNDFSEQKALVGKQQVNMKVTRCYKCGKLGHIKKYCRSTFVDKTKRQHKHKANAAENKHIESSSDSESVGLIVQHAMTSHFGKAAWVIDSGATCHMCNDKSVFVKYEELETPLRVILGDGYEVDAIGNGIVVLTNQLPGGKYQKCNLHHVLHVPRLSYNLLSVSAVTERGKIVKFGSDTCQVLDNGNLVGIGTKFGELFYLNCNKMRPSSYVTGTQAQQSVEDTWHHRYGHLGSRNLEKLAKDKLVNGFNYDPSRDISFCQACVDGKLHRSQFPTTGGKRAKEPLELIHSDVCGKIQTPSLGGGYYFLTFIDDSTRYVWVYILKNKSQVFEKFAQWKALVENLHRCKIKTLRSDNGGEYTSNEFTAYLKQEGIRHELTVPKTPQQNGVAERMNRTLVEIVRSMLSDAKLPKNFWAEALSTAVYLHNRSPTRAVLKKTPFEALTKEKPVVDYFKVFGCVCYAHIIKDDREKFDAKAKRCIMLGYGTETKAYRLYDLEKKKVIFSRDVVFDETKNVTHKDDDPSKNESGTKFVQLDCLNEDEIEEHQPLQVEEPNLPLRRSTRQRRLPDFYGERVTIVEKSSDPVSFKEALDREDKSQWINAMDKEMDSLSC